MKKMFKMVASIMLLSGVLSHAAYEVNSYDEQPITYPIDAEKLSSRRYQVAGGYNDQQIDNDMEQLAALEKACEANKQEEDGQGLWLGELSASKTSESKQVVEVADAAHRDDAVVSDDDSMTRRHHPSPEPLIGLHSINAQGLRQRLVQSTTSEKQERIETADANLVDDDGSVPEGMVANALKVVGRVSQTIAHNVTAFYGAHDMEEAGYCVIS